MIYQLVQESRFGVIILSIPAVDSSLLTATLFESKYTQKQALEYGLTGWIRNVDDGKVRIIFRQHQSKDD